MTFPSFDKCGQLAVSGEMNCKTAKLYWAALAIITTNCWPHLTPEEAHNKVCERAKEME